jgi:hypothetical protein
MPLYQITTMQIDDRGDKKSMIPDPYDIKGTPPRVQECMVSMDDESAVARRNRSCDPSVNKHDDAEVPTGERLVTRFRTWHGATSEQ